MTDPNFDIRPAWTVPDDVPPTIQTSLYNLFKFIDDHPGQINAIAGVVNSGDGNLAVICGIDCKKPDVPFIKAGLQTIIENIDAVNLMPILPENKTREPANWPACGKGTL